MTNEIIEQIPECVRFNDEDAQALIRNKDALLALEDGLVDGFYNAVYSYSITRAVFTDDERAAREQTLREWYRRTLNGPFDDAYWKWQTFVGLVHIKRKVNNAMVSGMWGWILTYLSENALEHLDKIEAKAVIKALHGLQAAVMALISESYLRNMFVAVDKASGIKEALLMRLVNIEIDGMLEDARSDSVL
ncbi:hypothetical protein MNBD_GAMMA18-2036 [hydrothermal vent metagenome]|uniref:Globin-sensor domain-containing protein n=1 Tax=hydrothermal vent metagenome TaxID=652676 RepID=A0A3B0ZE47_9ZZZZ